MQRLARKTPDRTTDESGRKFPPSLRGAPGDVHRVGPLALRTGADYSFAMVRASLALLLLMATSVMAQAQVASETPRARRAARLVVAADLRAERGDVGGALGTYRDAINADPRYLQGYLGLARGYLQLERADDALETLRVASARIPRSVELSLLHAQVLDAQGRVRDALMVLRLLCAWAPREIRAHRARAQAAQRSGAWTEALMSQRAVLRLALDDGERSDAAAMVRALSRLARLDTVCGESEVRRALCP